MEACLCAISCNTVAMVFPWVSQALCLEIKGVDQILSQAPFGSERSLFFGVPSQKYTYQCWTVHVVSRRWCNQLGSKILIEGSRRLGWVSQGRLMTFSGQVVVLGRALNHETGFVRWGGLMTEEVAQAKSLRKRVQPVFWKQWRICRMGPKLLGALGFCFLVTIGQ